MSARKFDLKPGSYGNITITELEGRLAVLLHGHAVLVFNRIRNEAIASSCGYKTATTKRAINTALRLAGFAQRVVQKDFSWFVTQASKEEMLPFIDGMDIKRIGQLHELKPNNEAYSFGGGRY